MPVDLSIIESTTELGQTVVEVVLESASEPGPAGPGVPIGGTLNQVLTKQSATDYDTDWEDAQGAGGGAPDDADYLVGTAHGDLSAEIVVGTSPGGEIGGTWASPTVNATHSGSSHAAVQAAAEATAAAALSSHEGDTTSVHGIADTSVLATDSEVATAVSDHSADTTSVHGIADTSVLATDSEVATAVSDHSADTTSVHGIADTSALETTTGAQAKVDAHVNDATDAHDATAISLLDAAGDFTATEVESALAELQTADEADEAALAAHIADASAAHAASAISADSTTLVGTGTDVQAVLEELDNGIADHLADAADAHDASAISFSPTGTIAATDVQAAIAEVASEAGGGTAADDESLIIHMEVFA